MAFQNIKISNKGALRIITIDNQSKKNALDMQSYQDIATSLNEAASDESVNVVAITGAGDFYSSGNDLSLRSMDGGDVQELRKKAQRVLKSMISAFIQFPKLLIAVVNGPSIGIAATTAALCDVVYATDNAYFYTPFTLLGLCAEGSSSYTFPRILGTSKASEMLLLNHKMSAAEALKFNFVSEVFTTSELATKLWPRIENYATLPKDSMRVSKKLLKKFDLVELEKACDDEMVELYKRQDSDEFMNAVINFMNRKSKL